MQPTQPEITRPLNEFHLLIDKQSRALVSHLALDLFLDSSIKLLGIHGCRRIRCNMSSHCYWLMERCDTVIQHTQLGMLCLDSVQNASLGNIGAVGCAHGHRKHSKLG